MPRLHLLFALNLVNSTSVPVFPLLHAVCRIRQWPQIVLGKRSSEKLPASHPLEAQFMLFFVALLVAKAELQQEKCPAELSVGSSSCEPSKGGPVFKLVQVPFRTEQASNEGPSESSNYFRYRGAAQRKSMRILVRRR